MFCRILNSEHFLLRVGHTAWKIMISAIFTLHSFYSRKTDGDQWSPVWCFGIVFSFILIPTYQSQKMVLWVKMDLYSAFPVCWLLFKKNCHINTFHTLVWLLIRCDLGFSILLTDTWHATEGTRDLNQQPSLALYLLSSSQPNVVEENLYQWEPIEFESSLRLLGRAAIVDPRSVKVLFLCLEEETKEGRDFGHLILFRTCGFQGVQGLVYDVAGN